MVQHLKGAIFSCEAFYGGPGDAVHKSQCWQVDEATFPLVESQVSSWWSELI